MRNRRRVRDQCLRLSCVQRSVPYCRLHRRQRSGHLVNLSSIGGLVGLPGWGIYNSQICHRGAFGNPQRSSALGIRVTIVSRGLSGPISSADRWPPPGRNSRLRANSRSHPRRGFAAQRLATGRSRTCGGSHHQGGRRGKSASAPPRLPWAMERASAGLKPCGANSPRGAAWRFRPTTPVRERPLDQSTPGESESPGKGWQARGISFTRNSGDGSRRAALGQPSHKRARIRPAAADLRTVEAGGQPPVRDSRSDPALKSAERNIVPKGALEWRRGSLERRRAATSRSHWKGNAAARAFPVNGDCKEPSGSSSYPDGAENKRRRRTLLDES